MTAFVYDAGSTGAGGWPQQGAVVSNPLSATGLCEFGGVRVHDGTFVLEALGGVTDTPEVRSTLTDRAQQHGAFLASSLYAARSVTVEGYTITEYVDQMWPAMDLLRKAFAIPANGGYIKVRFLQPGWPEGRFAMMRPAGALSVSGLRGSESRKPLREWQAVFVAPDPILYGDTLLDGPGSTHALGTSASMLNEGNFHSPLIWVVQGPAESPELIDDSRSLAIRYSGPIATGTTLTVNVKERTALHNGGNVYKNLTRFDDISIPPGGVSLRSTTLTTNPGGTWRAEHRAAWI